MLSWLPAKPDLSELIGAISKNPEASFEAIAALAGYRQDFLQTNRIDRVLRKRFSAPPAAWTSQPVRLAILGSSTLEQLPPGIRVAGLRRQLWVETFTGDYGLYRQDLEDEASALHGFEPNAILFVFDAASFFGAGDVLLSRQEARAQVEQAVAKITDLWEKAGRLCKGPVIQQTFLLDPLPIIGHNDYRLAGSLPSLVRAANEMLREISGEHGVDLLAIDELSARYGLEAWHDPALWHHAKQLISPVATPAYGDHVVRLLGARLGRSAKCLVLDLDNTLWGGIIGDDGLAGIQLGQGSGQGEAFVAFQRYIHSLSRRGIILAVCSKNDEANALAPFEKHPDMVLKREDIACFVANWQDKASNIRHIAKTLNIGLDSLVFADDNPFERELVRRELPMVSVPELPADPSGYGRCLCDAGYFEAATVTSDDLQRTRQYQDNQAREALLHSSSDVSGYLRSLQMKLIWAPFNDIGRQRVVQLVNKTNQFNLTTCRFGEADYDNYRAEKGSLTLQLRLQDSLGDNGIIAVIVARPEDDRPDVLRIHTWLMSCRVLGRQVEEATLNLLSEQALRQGAYRLIGDYRPTEKNAMVSSHYERLGFSRLGGETEARTEWLLDLKSYAPRETFIEIIEEGP